MFYVCYFFVYFCFLVLGSQNGRLISILFNIWQFGVILISPVWIRWLVPSFWVDEEIAPNFAQKCDSALIWSIVVTKRLNV